MKPDTQVLNRSSVELSVGRAPVIVLDKKLQASVKHPRTGKLHPGAERNVGAPMTFLSVLQIKTRDRCYQASKISPRAPEFGSDLGRPGFDIRGVLVEKDPASRIDTQDSSKIVGQFGRF